MIVQYRQPAGRNGIQCLDPQNWLTGLKRLLLSNLFTEIPVVPSIGGMSIASMDKETALRPGEAATETFNQIPTSIRIDDTTETPPKSMSIRIDNATPSTGNTVQYTQCTACTC